MVKITASKTHSVCFQVQLVFEITQDKRDVKLMQSLISLFHCGSLYKNRESFYFLVTKLEYLILKIIPFFQKYRIHGVKALDFAD